MKIKFFPILVALAALCTPAFGQTTAIFDNWNTGSVDNNPTGNPSFTISEPQMITYIDTYHWNYGSGTQSGGTITLRKDDGTEYGPWQVETKPGQGGVPNAWWIAYPNEVIPAGTYTIIDSEPETWSKNSESNDYGFSKVEGSGMGQSHAPGSLVLRSGDEGDVWKPLSWNHPMWGNPIGDPLAKWTWPSSQFVGGEVYTYKRDFYIDGPPTSGRLTITCDNSYQAFLNDLEVGSNGDWYGAETYDVADKLRQGANTLKIIAANDATPAGNPAGLLYRLELGWG